MRAIERGDSSSPVLLMLEDASTKDSPVGMYLHSSLIRLCHGPSAALAAGRRLRIGNLQIRRAMKSTGVPPRLLPSQEVAIVCDSQQEAMHLLRLQELHTPSQALSQSAIRVPELQQTLCRQPSGRKVRTYFLCCHAGHWHVWSQSRAQSVEGSAACSH